MFIFARCFSGDALHKNSLSDTKLTDASLLFFFFWMLKREYPGLVCLQVKYLPSPGHSCDTPACKDMPSGTRTHYSPLSISKADALTYISYCISSEQTLFCVWPWSTRPVTSNSQQHIKICILCQKSLKSCFMKIFCTFSTVNISKRNFWFAICIVKDFTWTTLKAIFSILWFFWFAHSDSRFSNSCISSKYCSILTNPTSMESLFIQCLDV